MPEPVRLHNITAFKRALQNYRMSDHAEQVLKASRLVILSGIAGGGRNTTINYLVKQFDYFFLVSDTTRPPKLRDGVMERSGINYYFRSEPDMLRDIQNGEFVEAEIIHNQQVSGTSIRELELANQTGHVTLHETEFGGVHTFAQFKPDAHIIGLLPPSYQEWLRRLNAREVMSDLEFRNRLQTAEAVLTSMLRQDYFKFVINTNIEQCADDIRRIVEAGVYDDEHKFAGTMVVQNLLIEVTRALAL